MAKKKAAKKVNKRKPAAKTPARPARRTTRGIPWHSADYTLIVLTFALVIFGVIMVFSASYYWSIDKTGTPYHFLIRDVIFAGAGFVLMIICTSTGSVPRKWTAIRSRAGATAAPAITVRRDSDRMATISLLRLCFLKKPFIPTSKKKA